jgi:four helix bundle protein
MYFKFEKIIVWQKAMELGERMNIIARSFPEIERYNLTSQSVRAADSIALNIAEGSISQSTPEFRRFVGYAIRSLAELVTCIKKARNRNYISISEYDDLYGYSYNLMNMMIAFKRNLT